MKRPLFIILEGLDNVGKTTQLRCIQEKYSDIIFHNLKYSSLPFKDPIKQREYSAQMYEEMFGIMEDSLEEGDTSYIFDRSHLGEAVYSPLYRNHNGNYVFQIEQRHVEYLEDHLFMIVFTGDAEAVHKRDDGLSFYTNVEDAQKEIDYFKAAFDKSLIKNKIMINVTGKSIEDVSEEIFKFLG